jgi:hypothetical protein
VTVIRASIFVIILVGIFIGYRVWQSPEVEMESAPAIQNVPPVVVPNGTVDVEVETILPTGNIPITSLDQPGCLTERQFEELPELMQEAERMEAISASGTALTAYENLGEDSLQSFANQGDSAAMVVLGAMQVMRAYEIDDSRAIDWLSGKNLIDDVNIGTDELSGTASLALNEAAYWFYEAASHGRVMALQQYGQVKGRLFGGPVGLGWVSQTEYDALTLGEKNSLIPNNLYGQVAYDVVPAIREGAIGSLLSDLSPVSSKQVEIREKLRVEFDRNLDDRGLPRIQIAAAATTTMKDLFDRICDSVKHEEIRQRSLQ